MKISRAKDRRMEDTSHTIRNPRSTSYSGLATRSESPTLGSFQVRGYYAVSEMMSVNETWMRADRVEAWTKRLFGLTDWVTISVEPERTASWDYAKDEEFAAVFQE